MKYPVIAAPQHKLNVSSTYSKNRWRISADMMWVAGLYTSVEPESKETYLLLNLSGDFNVNSVVKVFAKGENLLAQKYEINKGYPMPKATVMFGVDLSF